MPPRSTNAPKSAMFLTTPLRISPCLISLSSALLHLLALIFDQLAAAHHDVPASFVDLQNHALTSGRCNPPISAGRRMSTWLAGRNTGTPMSTSNPALDLPHHLAGDHVPFLVAGDDFSQSRIVGLAPREQDMPSSSSTSSSSTSIFWPGVGGCRLPLPTRWQGQCLHLVADVHQDVVPFPGGRRHAGKDVPGFERTGRFVVQPSRALRLFRGEQSPRTSRQAPLQIR